MKLWLKMNIKRGLKEKVIINYRILTFEMCVSKNNQISSNLYCNDYDSICMLYLHILLIMRTNMHYVNFVSFSCVKILCKHTLFLFILETVNVTSKQKGNKTYREIIEYKRNNWCTLYLGSCVPTCETLVIVLVNINNAQLI